MKSIWRLPQSKIAPLPSDLEWLVSIEKKAILPIKWTLLGVSLILVILQRGGYFSFPFQIFILLLLYALSNLFFSYIYYFRRYEVNQIVLLSYYSLAIDLIVVTLLIYLTPIVSSQYGISSLESDFYLLYFLVILRGVLLSPTKKGSLILGFIISCLYLLALSISAQSFEFVISVPFISKLILIWGSLLIAWFLLEIVNTQKEKIQKQLEEIKQMENKLIQSEKLATLGELAANVAHEINNPLTAIYGLADFLLKSNLQKTELNTDAILKDLQIIVTEAKRAHKIITELLYLTGPIENIKEKNFVLLSLNKVIQDALMEVRQNREYQVERIKLITNLNSNIPEIYGNRILLTRALANIISTIYEKLPVNGNLSVSTSFNNTNEEVILEISYRGNNVKPEDIENVFFFLSSDKRVNEGLSLIIAHRIIDWHRGKIFLTKDSEKGVRLIIKLPVTKDILAKQI